MRPIKFRAWCNRTKKWLETDHIGVLANGTIMYRSTYNEVGGQMAYTECSSLDVVIMQFTGLLDSKGKEIYEGDIVKIGEDLIVEIKWVDESNWIGKCPVVGFVNNNAIYSDPVEVIGNIYEHPNLLK